ncbi:MAG: TlpA family protein disulfide reductase [Desulfobulbaceae bacterium]|nr:TlpA family protein disulfide reductase [Desulfobulbaceae bacterium]HIJ91504.1 TlpA family protein disulfide reductase [Deltaproteobacteria bacterium]
MKRFFYPVAILCLTFQLVACGPRNDVAEVGKPAPQFTLVDTKGKTWNLAELKGKVVFLNFWATWCPPCREEMPSMQTVHTLMREDPFVMLAVLSNDTPALADAMAEKIGTTFPILIDPNSTASKAYGLTGVPETYIIDKQGVIREKFLGAVNWNSIESMQMLRKYLAQ